VVAVVVAPDRSERHTAPAVRAALSRMATALLVQGTRRLVVHGGAAAWQRELRDGLDSRIELRFYPHVGRGPLPDTGAADVVVLWDTAVGDPRLTERHPNAMLILQRGLIPFCQAVVDQVNV
jgi:diadenosine tetraphosphatase ApaH/serine/threonine PP2A family protein phosphatase